LPSAQNVRISLGVWLSKVMKLACSGSVCGRSVVPSRYSGRSDGITVGCRSGDDRAPMRCSFAACSRLKPT
jgi:hypothetical protein